MALVLKTSVRKYRKFESCPFRHEIANLGVSSCSLADEGALRKKKTPILTILGFDKQKFADLGEFLLSAVLETGMFALVAVLVIVIAILTSDGFECKFSCHGEIIAQKAQK